MTSAWIPVAAAGLGAGGAVGAQIVSAIFTARRETSRLQWEKDRQAREWKMRESERFLASKQELYTRYISLLYQPAADLVAFTETEYTEQPDWLSKVPDYVGLTDEINELRWKIKLLGSPVVYERVEFSNATLLIAMQQAISPSRTLERQHETATRALRAWQDVSNVMRDDLKGDEAALTKRWEQLNVKSTERRNAT